MHYSNNLGRHGFPYSSESRIMRLIVQSVHKSPRPSQALGQQALHITTQSWPSDASQLSTFLKLPEAFVRSADAIGLTRAQKAKRRQWLVSCVRERR